MNNNDNVIKQINEFFQQLKFKKLTINGKGVFQYNNDYFMVTNGGTKSSYFLEYARTLHEAENNLYEDIEAYSVESFSEEEIIEIIKGDIVKYFVED